MAEHENERQGILIVSRYPKWLGIAGFFSMALFHLPLFFNRRIRFYKLMGTGRNGTFDIVPDFRQWAIMLSISQEENVLLNAHEINDMISSSCGGFIKGWLSFFGAANQAYLLQAVAGHGSWDGKQPFGQLSRQGASNVAPIGVLTRATIRWKSLPAFWKHVGPVAAQMAQAPGFVTSVGIGEAPFFRQATFSIWTDAESMKNFAYQQALHKEVVRKTYKEAWYSEEMFVRFAVLKAWNNSAVETLLK